MPMMRERTYTSSTVYTYSNIPNKSFDGVCMWKEEMYLKHFTVLEIVVTLYKVDIVILDMILILMFYLTMSNLFIYYF